MTSSFRQYDPVLEKWLSFVPVVYDRDLELIHRWMNEAHVIPYWQLNVSLKQFSQKLKNGLMDAHQTLYLGCVDDIPMSYWEVYWVQGDVVEQSYKAMPYDQGVHLLIGDRSYLGKGYSLPLLQAIVDFQFRQVKTKKVVAEPDIRNEKMIHIFEKCGFKKVKPIKLPDKTGLLMFCNREEFYGRVEHDRNHRIRPHT